MLGQIIHRLRRKRGLSQERLAVQAHCALATLQRLESSKTTPRTSVLIDVLRALGDVAPLSDAEKTEVSAAAGIDPHALNLTIPPAMLETLSQSAAVVDEAHARLDYLLQESEHPEAIAAMLEHLAIAWNLPALTIRPRAKPIPAAPTDLVSVVVAERKGRDMDEQIRRVYERPTPAPAAKPTAEPRQRRSRAG